MTCYHPLQGWYSSTVNPTGKRSIVFNHRESNGDEVNLSCGQCIGCRLERSRQWAIRILHEASLNENNCFLTLTYDQYSIPKDHSLSIYTYQKFMKRLRKKYGAHIRFFHCGEYGENTERPHYHACIFNFDFQDKYHWRTTELGHKIYRSKSLDGMPEGSTIRCYGGTEGLWPLGNCEIGNVTFESAAYVARYITKKILGPDSDLAYLDLNYKQNGFIKQKEYVTMSRKPGIGKAWLQKYKTDVYPCDYIVIRGKKMRAPKYYDTQLGLEDPSLLEDLKEAREQKGKIYAHDNHLIRRITKEIVHEAQAKFLKRGYENES